jgi:hypothetical protein
MGTGEVQRYMVTRVVKGYMGAGIIQKSGVQESYSCIKEVQE